MSLSKNDYRYQRKIRIRKKIFGTADRPRLVVYRSNMHTYAQIIDDFLGVTLLAASTLLTNRKKSSCNISSAESLGKEVARLALEKNIKRIVFDRNGYLYHGKVRAVAEGARQGGLEF